MPPFKVVVTDHEFPDFAPEEAVLAEIGVVPVIAPDKREETLIELCRDADGVINEYAQVTGRVIAAMERCRIISRYGIGLNTIDVDTATTVGITVANSPDASMNEVSEHAIALIMACARGVGLHTASIRKGNYSYMVAAPLYRMQGRTLGLVGLGRIPRMLAAKMAGFEFNVIAFDPHLDPAIAAAAGIRLVVLDTLCREADIVSVHCPLTPETEKLIGPAQFAAMKPGVVFVNTARGPVVDEAALIAALEAGHVGSAGLDVFVTEPLPADHPFTAMDNVVLTPHTAWYSEESEIEIRSKTARNVVEALSGKYPTYLANPAVRGHERLKDVLK